MTPANDNTSSRRPLKWWIWNTFTLAALLLAYAAMLGVHG